MTDHHNSTAPYRCSREIIDIFEAEEVGVETFGLVGKTPWGELCYIALTFNIMSSPTMKSYISAPSVQVVVIFN